MTSPTSSPWNVFGFHVVGPNHRLVANCHNVEPTDPGYNDAAGIAEDKANARLCAAAPTLYEYARRQAQRGDEEAAFLVREILGGAP